MSRNEQARTVSIVFTAQPHVVKLSVLAVGTCQVETGEVRIDRKEEMWELISFILSFSLRCERTTMQSLMNEVIPDIKGCFRQTYHHRLCTSAYTS
jgi:hypothetical protein